MSYDERMKGGLETYRKTHGTVLGDPGEIDPDSYNAHILRTVYNDVWARENMSMRERRLLVIGALAAQALEWPLRTHLACALQMGELGKVDEGGGGTVAKYLALYGMDIIDCGTPMLSMHSPFEVASKGDIYETFRAYRAFLEEG